MSCCQEIPHVSCDIGNILSRIEPITYQGGTLIVDSPISVNGDVRIGGELIVVRNGVLELPIDTTIAGTPLNALPFTGDVLTLPPQTTIDGFTIFTTNYFYFFNTSERTTSGSYIINGTVIGMFNPTTDNIRFPFFVPENCVLTSLIFSFATSSNAPSTVANATAYIDVVSPTGVVAYSGISTTIPSCPRGTRYYSDTTFQYPVAKGHSVGVRFTYSGSAGSTCQYATIGYRFIL